MRGIDVIAMLKSVAGDFVKDSRQKINGAELNRLYVGFERKWQISHGETTDTLYVQECHIGVKELVEAGNKEVSDETVARS